MSLHRIWGSAQPYPQSAFTDGDPFIRLAGIFYLLAGQTWTCVGGRVYIPESAPIQSAGIRIMAWHGLHENPIDLAVAPLRSVETTTPPAAGWAEVSWPPFNVVGGQTAVAIGYEFIAVPTTYLFTSPAEIGTTEPVQAEDGSPFFFAEQAYTGNRSRFRTDGATNGSNAWYGSDIVLDDGLDPEPEAIEVFWNDAGVQQSGQLYYNPGTGAAPVLAIAKG